MRAIAEHHVEQDHRDFGVGGFRQQALVAQPVVDHRVRPAAREHVVAEVDDGVAERLPGVLHLARRVDRRVRPRVAEEVGRFVAERAAAVEAADELLILPEFHSRNFLVGGHGARRALAGGERHRRQRGFLQRLDGVEVRAARRLGGADEVDHHRLAGAARGVEHLLRHARSRRLGDEHDHARLRVAREQLQPVQHGDAADVLVQVVAAGADRVRDAGAAAVHQARHLLRAGARGAHHADRAAAHRVGEAERNAVDDRGAAIRPHDEEVSLPSILLQGNFIGERNVIAEQHHVEAEPQRLHRLGGSVFAGHRDQREVRLGRLREAHLQAARRFARGPAGCGVRGRLLERVERRGHRRLECGRGFSAQRDQQVVRARRERAVHQPGGAQELEVRRRRHHRGDLLDAGQFAERRRELHQRHRVAVQVGQHPVDVHRLVY